MRPVQQYRDFWLKRLNRRQSLKALVMVLSDENSRTKGFLIGTDDYITKPFTIPELNARVTRLLRRTYGL